MIIFTNIIFFIEPINNFNLKKPLSKINCSKLYYHLSLIKKIKIYHLSNNNNPIFGNFYLASIFKNTL